MPRSLQMQQPGKRNSKFGFSSLPGRNAFALIQLGMLYGNVVANAEGWHGPTISVTVVIDISYGMQTLRCSRQPERGCVPLPVGIPGTPFMVPHLRRTHVQCG
jgi:hypothetical protein